MCVMMWWIFVQLFWLMKMNQWWTMIIFVTHEHFAILWIRNYGNMNLPWICLKTVCTLTNRIWYYDTENLNHHVTFWNSTNTMIHYNLVLLSDTTTLTRNTCRTFLLVWQIVQVNACRIKFNCDGMMQYATMNVQLPKPLLGFCKLQACSCINQIVRRSYQNMYHVLQH